MKPIYLIILFLIAFILAFCGRLCGTNKLDKAYNTAPQEIQVIAGVAVRDNVISVTDTGQVIRHTPLTVPISNGTHRYAVYYKGKTHTIVLSNQKNREMLLLANIIEGEAGGESLRCKIAVGNVVTNRMNSNRFGNSVYSVVSARGQFSTYRRSGRYKKPSTASKQAALLAISGKVHILPKKVLFFKAASCKTKWNRKYYCRINGTNFYY